MAHPKKILFLCAHNQSRSVTAEGLLTGEKGYEVRSRALWKGQPRKVSKWDGQWADEVYVMMPGMKPVAVEAGVPEKKIKSLWVPDVYIGCEPKLLLNLKNQLAEHGIHVTKPITKAESDCERVMARKLGYTRMLSWDWEFGTPLRKGDFFEPVSGHVTSAKPPEETTGFGYVPMWHMREGERRKQQEREEAELLEKFRQGDESEEEIVERANRLWKFYSDPKQRKL